MVKKISVFYQFVIVTFVSNIIQFTFVLSFSIHSFINIDTDAVGFHITHCFTKLHYHDFIDANQVVY